MSKVISLADYKQKFVDNDLEFKSLNEDEQRALIGNKIRDKVLKHKER